MPRIFHRSGTPRITESQSVALVKEMKCYKYKYFIKGIFGMTFLRSTTSLSYLHNVRNRYGYVYLQTDRRNYLVTDDSHRPL